MPSQKGYLIPEVINPLTTRCVTFYVPDDVWWLAAFWGQMTALADPFMWEGTEAQRQEITEIWEGVLSTARQNFEAGDCELTLEFRVIGGIVEYRPYPSAGWIAIGEACACPPVIPSPQYNPDVTTTEELACNVANGIIEWLMTKYNDTLDAITAASTTAGAFDAIFLIFPPAYLIADVILDAIQEVINATVAVARAYDTLERREEMAQWLYCEMASTGEMTSEVWSDFKAVFDAGEFGGASPGKSAMYPYLQSFEEEAILARSRIESYNTGNCAGYSCGYEWEFVLDFETNQSKLIFTDRSPYTSQIVAEGLKALATTQTTPNPDLSSRRVDGFIPLTYEDSTTRIKSAIFDYVQGAAGNGNGAPPDPLVTMRLWTSANVQIGAETSGNIGISFPDGIKAVDLPGVTAISAGDKLYMAIVFTTRSSNTAQPVTGSGTLSKLTIRGDGKNPFIV